MFHFHWLRNHLLTTFAYIGHVNISAPLFHYVTWVVSSMYLVILHWMKCENVCLTLYSAKYWIYYRKLMWRNPKTITVKTCDLEMLQKGERNKNEGKNYKVFQFMWNKFSKDISRLNIRCLGRVKQLLGKNICVCKSNHVV